MPQTTSTLNPAAPSFHFPYGFTDIPSTPTENPKSKPKQRSQPASTSNVTGARRKTKQLPASDPNSIELEYTKYALNSAKTEICNLENELNDLKFRNKILNDRLAVLEKRQKDGIDDIISDTVRPPEISRRTANHCCHQQAT